MNSTARCVVSVVAVIVASLASAAVASAQTKTGAWEIEFHGGFLSAGHSSSGTPIAGFATGAAIPTPSGMPSRAVSSWFFGDGAVLLNAVNTIHGTPALVIPLDGMLRSAAAGSAGGANFGLRIGRRLVPHVSVEFGVDYAMTPVAFTGEARDAIEATRSSFIDAWDDFLDSTPSATARNVAASADTAAGSGAQLLVTGAVKYHLRPIRKAVPYVLAGVGAEWNHGDDPQIALTGLYDFGFANGTIPINETDNVKIRAVSRGGRLATIFGGGVDVAAVTGGTLRVEVRGVIDSRVADVFVDASPQVFTSASAGATSTFTNPSIQFSNNVSTGRTSSLSGPVIDGLQTFAATGKTVRMNLTIGYVMRF